MKKQWISLVLLLSTSGCSPAAPSCDPRGVKEPTTLIVSCTPNGSNLQCNGFATNRGELYICIPVTVDVTEQTVWQSSDPATATFNLPAPPAGFLQVVAR